MKYIYIDESGDLGLTERSSRCFVISGAIVDDERVLGKIANKIWKTFKNKKRGELHAIHENSITRKRILRMIGDTTGINIVTAIFNKSKFRNNISVDYLYSSILSYFIESIFHNEYIKSDEGVRIFIDQRNLKKVLKDALIRNMKQIIEEYHNKNYILNFTISHNSKAIQVVDFISWAIFRKNEIDEDEFFELIKDRIVLTLEYKKKAP